MGTKYDHNAIKKAFHISDEEIDDFLNGIYSTKFNIKDYLYKTSIKYIDEKTEKLSFKEMWKWSHK